MVVDGLLRTLRAGADAARAAEVGRILVVDDSEANRDLLERRLVHEGHDGEAGGVRPEGSRPALAAEAFDLDSPRSA